MSINFIFTFFDQSKLASVYFLAFEGSEIRDL